MAKTGLQKFSKCLLFTATFLIFAAGIGVFSVGIWASLHKVSAIQQLLGSELYTYAAYVFIGTGAVIAIISSIGCCGAVKEDKFKLGLYFLVLLVVFVILLAGGILGYKFNSELDEKLKSKMILSTKEYNKSDHITTAWNAIQVHFNCCGLSVENGSDSYRIWEENEYLKKDNLRVPITCCKDMKDTGPCQNDPKTHAHDRDCYVVAKDYFKKNSKIIGAIGVGIAVFLIVGMVLTCIVFRSL